jgi:hypothetical protein
MTLAAWVANSVWRLASRPEARRFTRAMTDIEVTQRARLARILHINAGTAYGRRYRFADITSAEAYQARVPLVTHEGLRLEIEAMAAGEPDVLIPGRPSYFVPTSGSTAATKLIPYNDALRDEFQRGIAAWVAEMFRTCPALQGGPAYWSISPATWEQRCTPGGIPIGCEDDTEYLHPIIARLLGQAMAVPPVVARIHDMAAFRYVTLRCLLAARELRFISVWNPTFLTLLLASLEGWEQTLIHDLATGTLMPPGEVPPAIMASLRCAIRPNPRRAREVEEALGAVTDAERFTRLWPRLALISCWTSAAAAGPARDLARLFPHVSIVGKGLLATEGVVSFPLSGHPGSALAVRSHFLEFVPADGGRVCCAWELQAGAEYQVVLTTGGGLYRYQLGDMVRVVGFAGACPLIDFVGRHGRVSDLYGEKLHEAHVASAIDRACQAAGVQPGFTLLAPDGQGRPDHYALFIATHAPITEGQQHALTSALESALRENIHYDYCSRLGQLQSAEVNILPVAPAHAHVLYTETLRSRGMRAGEVKPAVLDADSAWKHRFQACEVSTVFGQGKGG